MVTNTDFSVTEIISDSRILTRNTAVRDERVYTYDEALEIGSNITYSLMLFTVLTISFVAMTLDIFGFSVVVTGAQCDLNLGVHETSVLLTVSFIGPILMSYPWGFISDTYGRQKSLMISLWTSFFVSIACAFSTNWITLAVLKLISTSLSSCVQSTTFILLGESCSLRYRDKMMLIMANISDMNAIIYSVLAYFILQMDFSQDFGFINLVPWRLLSIALSLFMGLGAIGILFCYESPKFLLNSEKHDEALTILAKIWKMNGSKKEFPVKNVILNESGNRRVENGITKRLLEQVVPIFKPPLLWRSLQLFLLNAVIYGTNNNFFMWLPYLGQQFVDYTNSNDTDDQANLCTMIETNDLSNGAIDSSCTASMDVTVIYFIIAQGAGYATMVFILSWVAHRKRVIVASICLFSSICCVCAILIDERTVSFIMYLGILMNQLVIGIVYSYFVELYPTSCRGMAACLGTMVARLSSIIAISIFGSILQSFCSPFFYLSAATLLCAAIAAVFLPPDRTRTKSQI